MGLTEAQLTAVAARGNVLVVAGAGAGKTKTLVERCRLHAAGEATGVPRGDPDEGDV